MAIDPATGEKEEEIKDEALKARCEADSRIKQEVRVMLGRSVIRSTTCRNRPEADASPTSRETAGHTGERAADPPIASNSSRLCTDYTPPPQNEKRDEKETAFDYFIKRFFNLYWSVFTQN